MAYIVNKNKLCMSVPFHKYTKNILCTTEHVKHLPPCESRFGVPEKGEYIIFLMLMQHII